MIRWLRAWWHDLDPVALVGCAVASFLLAGMYACAMQPPQVVYDRFRTRHTVSHSSCSGYDAKGNCTYSHTWTTVEPLYVLVDAEGEECEVVGWTYERVAFGEAVKCYQLWGWGVVWDREFPIESRGWRR